MIEKRPGYVLAIRTNDAILLIRETWFLDLDAGFPWKTILGQKNPDLSIVRQQFRIFFEGIPGCVRVPRCDVALSKDRKLIVDFEQIASDGSSVTGLNPFLVDGVPAFPAGSSIGADSGALELG